MFQLYLPPNGPIKQAPPLRQENKQPSYPYAPSEQQFGQKHHNQELLPPWSLTVIPEMFYNPPRSSRHESNLRDSLVRSGLYPINQGIRNRNHRCCRRLLCLPTHQRMTTIQGVSRQCGDNTSFLGVCARYHTLGILRSETQRLLERDGR